MQLSKNSEQSPIKVNVSVANLDGETSLRQAIANIQRKADAKQLFFSWPNLHEICLLFAQYVTNLYPASADVSYLETALSKGFDVNDSLAAAGVRNERDFAFGFMDALLDTSPSLMDWEARSNDGQMCWLPMGNPFGAWLQKNEIKNVVFNHRVATDAERDAAIQMMQIAILDYREQKEYLDWKSTQKISNTNGGM